MLGMDSAVWSNKLTEQMEIDSLQTTVQTRASEVAPQWKLVISRQLNGLVVFLQCSSADFFFGRSLTLIILACKLQCLQVAHSRSDLKNTLRKMMLCISGESHGHINFTLLSKMLFDEASAEVVQQTTSGAF